MKTTFKILLGLFISRHGRDVYLENTLPIARNKYITGAQVEKNLYFGFEFTLPVGRSVSMLQPNMHNRPK